MKLSKRQFYLLVSNSVIIVDIKAWSPVTFRWRPPPPPTFSNELYFRDFRNEYQTPFEQDLLEPPYLYESDFSEDYEWREQEIQPEFGYRPRREFRRSFEDEREDLAQFWEEKEWDLEEERLNFNAYYDRKIRKIIEQKEDLGIEGPSSFRNSFGMMRRRVPDDILGLPTMRSDILRRDIEWDIPVILDEASIYLEDDPLCADLLGLPIHLNSPFSESYEKLSVKDQRGDQMLSLKLRVEGPRNSGTVELMVTETGIYDIFLRVDESREGERMSRTLSPPPRINSNPNILDAEIIDRE